MADLFTEFKLALFGNQQFSHFRSITYPSGHVVGIGGPMVVVQHQHSEDDGQGAH